MKGSNFSWDIATLGLIGSSRLRSPSGSASDYSLLVARTTIIASIVIEVFRPPRGGAVAILRT